MKARKALKTSKTYKDNMFLDKMSLSKLANLEELVLEDFETNSSLIYDLFENKPNLNSIRTGL